jgi:Zn-dependent protease
MIFNLFEILDIIVMTAIIGFIFHDTFRKPVTVEDDIVEHYRRKRGTLGVEWHDFLWACALVGPTILFHELAHKFTALGFGLDATFHAACSTANLIPGGAPFLDLYCGLTAISLFFKVIGFGFIFFVPGYVLIGGGGTYLQYALSAFAGPFVHLVFWLGAAHLMKNRKLMRKLPERKRLYLFFFKQINMFLFILNMIPIPGFDGFSVFYNLFKMLF